MSKCTNAEHTNRVNKVYDLLINGFSRKNILEYVRKNEWGVKRGQIDNYIRDANLLIVEDAVETRDEFRAKSKLKLDDLYKKAMTLHNQTSNSYMELQQVSECRRIIETANKVLGYEKLNLEIEGEVSIKDIDDKIKTLERLIKLDTEQDTASKD